MGNLADILRCAWDNDARGVNKLLEEEGRRHHADYISKMMMDNDVDANYELLSMASQIMEALYCSVRENYSLKAKGRDIIGCSSAGGSALCNEFRLPTEKQLYDMVHYQALHYYFGEDISDRTDYDALLNRAVLHRRVSVGLQYSVRCILMKMEEDIEIIAADTSNLNFLISSYEKVSRKDSRLSDISELLADSIKNVVLQDDKFGEAYFQTAKKLMKSTKLYFYGG